MSRTVSTTSERLAAEIVGMWTVPGFRAGSGDVDAASRTDPVGELEPRLAQLHCAGTCQLVGAERIAPGPNLGDHDVRSLGGVRVGTDGVRVGVVVQGQ
jgi:hypothetical protein